jgi:MOSC domain-containing protein YiiM
VAGVLLGIARKDAPRARMETLASSWIGLDCGVFGDHRGRVKPGKLPKRQVTVLAREDWEAACAEAGAGHQPWYLRRANLYVDGIDLPQRPGAVIAIGATVRLQVMVETEPCARMNDVAPGLEQAMRPDWRGGVCCRVLAEGKAQLGDPVRIEAEQVETNQPLSKTLALSAVEAR